MVIILEGILEHIIFLLEEKSIKYELNVIGLKNGFDKNCIIIKFNGSFIHIVKRLERVSYKYGIMGERMSRISKESLIELVQKL